MDSQIQLFIRELDRKKEEERQKIIDELKLIRNDKLKLTKKGKAEIFNLKKENIKREILILKNEVEKFEKHRKREDEYFLETLRDMPEAEAEADLEDEEVVLCFEPEEREEQVNEISKLLKFSFNLYKFIKWSSKHITKHCTTNEDFLIQ